MNYYQHITGSVQDLMAALSLAVDELAPAIEQAGQELSQCLLADGKIIVSASQLDAPLAQLFSANLIGSASEPRPALPVLCLDSDSEQASTSLSHKIRALGNAGDVLLFITSQAHSSGYQACLEAARERNMRCILLSNEQPTSANCAEVIIGVHSATRRSRVLEVHTLVLNCLAELIDINLFGSLTRE